MLALISTYKSKQTGTDAEWAKSVLEAITTAKDFTGLQSILQQNQKKAVGISKSGRRALIASLSTELAKREKDAEFHAETVSGYSPAIPVDNADYSPAIPADNTSERATHGSLTDAIEEQAVTATSNEPLRPAHHQEHNKESLDPESPFYTGPKTASTPISKVLVGDRETIIAYSHKDHQPKENRPLEVKDLKELEALVSTYNKHRGLLTQRNGAERIVITKRNENTIEISIPKKEMQLFLLHAQGLFVDRATHHKSSTDSETNTDRGPQFFNASNWHTASSWHTTTTRENRLSDSHLTAMDDRESAATTTAEATVTTAEAMEGREPPPLPDSKSSEQSPKVTGFNSCGNTAAAEPPTLTL